MWETYFAEGERGVFVETIITFVDLDRGTDEVMTATVKYAKALDATVILVDIEPLLPGAAGASEEELTRDIRESYGEEIRTIHDLGEDLSNAGVVNRVLMIEGTAADQLPMEAEREQADLVVIPSLPHGALVEAFTHGLREQLARKSRCPVLLVPVS